MMGRRGFSAVMRSGKMWRTRRLRPVARVALLIAAAVLALVTVGFAISAGEFVLGDFTMLLLSGGIAAFAWQPAAAAFSVLAICTFEVFYRASGSGALNLAMLMGLVAATCSPWLVAGYALATVGLAWYASVGDSTLHDNGALGVAGAALVSLLIGFASRFAAAREELLDAERRRTVAVLDRMAHDERERIADELHDGIAHDLTLVLFQARALPRFTTEKDRDISYAAIERSAQRAHGSIRALLALIREPGELRADSAARYGVGLPANVTALAELLEGAGIEIKTSVDAKPGSLPSEVEHEFVRLAIEAVTNILKHAPTSISVSIDLAVRKTEAEFTVLNVTPHGPSNSGAPSSGQGLERARQRIEKLGGRITAKPTATGWVTNATLPLADVR